MIVIKLQGGLGNQMFQYATARRLSLRHNVELKIDVSGFDKTDNKTTTRRHYELDCYNIKAKFATKSDLSKYNGATINSYLQRVYNRFRIPNHTILYEPSYIFYPRLFRAPNDILLIGYWQTEKYFKDIRQTLLRDFSYKEPPSRHNQILLDKIHSTNAISIHVRRGDYATLKNAADFHGLTGAEYYQKATQTMENNIPNPHFFVFSDDPEWGKQNLKFNQPTMYISLNKKGSDDMRLMRACKHNIIANSSFSWWGAWLNENNNKVVIAPRHWFADKETDTKDVIPNEWIKI